MASQLDRVELELRRALQRLQEYSEAKGEGYTPDQLSDVKAELESLFLAGQDYGEWGDEIFD